MKRLDLSHITIEGCHQCPFATYGHVIQIGGEGWLELEDCKFTGERVDMEKCPLPDAGEDNDTENS